MVLLASAQAAPIPHKRQDTPSDAEATVATDEAIIPPSTARAEGTNPLGIPDPAVLISQAATPEVSAALSSALSSATAGRSSATASSSKTAVSSLSAQRSSSLVTTATASTTAATTATPITQYITTTVPELSETPASSSSATASSSTVAAAGDTVNKGGVTSGGAIAGVVLAVVAVILSLFALGLWLQARAAHRYKSVPPEHRDVAGYRKPSEDIRMSVLSESEGASLAEHPAPTPLTEHSLRTLDETNNPAPLSLGPTPGPQARIPSDEPASVVSTMEEEPVGYMGSPLKELVDWGAQRHLALQARLDAAAGVPPSELPGVRVRDLSTDVEAAPPRFVPFQGSWQRGTFGPMTASSAGTTHSATSGHSGESDPTLVSRLEQTTPESSPERPVDPRTLLSPISTESVYSTSAETAIHVPEASTSRLPPPPLPTLPEGSDVWVTTPAITLTDPAASRAMLAHTASRRRSGQFTGTPAKTRLQQEAYEAHGRQGSTSRYPVAYHHGSLGGQIVHGESEGSSHASDASAAEIIELPRRRWSGGSRQWRALE
ncbi:hypothetical protein Q8F55_005939 [Vanrija albida]|uniref:Transmembrane protein n=1 Tax=Vanrija albida TaxID=181172 RepID=A0ABR3Q3K6_9TREE